MNKLICLLCCFSFTCIGYSQMSSYDLNAYTQPDYYRKISFISPRFSYESDVRKYEESLYDSSRVINPSLDYRLQINQYNQKSQSTLFISQSPSFIFSDNLNSKDKRGRLTSNIFYNKKHFLTDQDFFIGYDITHSGTGTMSTSDPKETFSFLTKNKRNFFNTTNNVSVTTGKGRIENVDVAFHAIQILNRICDHGRMLPDDISHEQVTALANKLGDLRNIRNPDSRLEENQEVEMLFNYLENQSLLNKDDYHLIADVLDAYTFESFVIRNKGSDWHFGLGFRHFHNIIHDLLFQNDGTLLEERNDIESQLGPFVETGFSYYKPLSHQWQLDNTNTLRIGISRITDYVDNGNPENPFRDDDTNSRWIELNTRMDLSYIFNSRTNIFIRFINNIDISRSSLDGTIRKELFYQSLTDIGMIYFFSPRHTLSMNVGLNYRKGFLQSNLKFIQTQTRLGVNYYFN